jgi:hypothetical protein
VVVGKLWGSLYAMRWLLVATLWAWTLALAFEEMTGALYVYLVANTAICSAFMAAVGVRTSLAFSTATRSMALTAGIWLSALGITAALSAVFVVILLMAYQIASWQLTGTAAPAAFPRFFLAGFQIVQLLGYVLLTALVVIECGMRFDRIAGRMAGGAMQVAVDRALHGLPTAPVLIDPTAETAAVPADPG